MYEKNSLRALSSEKFRPQHRFIAELHVYSKKYVQYEMSTFFLPDWRKSIVKNQ